MDTSANETPAGPEAAGAPGDAGAGAGPSPTSTTATSELPPSQAAGHDHGHREMRLHRRSRGRMLGGVAVGLADYFDVDPVLVRIGFVALAFLGGLAVPLYLAGWALIPDEETDTSIAEELLARERASSAY
jgi:phage shock protein PspC (stress-responsive transcriptional regulator)